MLEKSSNSLNIIYPPSQQRVIKQIKLLIRQLVRKYEIQCVILFGSYAKGNYGFGSDTDLLIIHNDELSFESALSEALDITCEIDWQLHMYSIDEIRSTHTRQKVFLSHILEHGIILYQTEGIRQHLEIKPYINSVD